MRGSAQAGGQIHQHSGWLVPFCVLLVLLALSTAVLLYYLRPLTLPAGPPATMPTPVALSVDGVRFRIPANYLEDAAARHGGAQQSVMLFALLPGFAGYSGHAAAAFAGNAPDSPVLHLTLRAMGNIVPPAERLARLYRPYIADPKGHTDSFGLTRYDFQSGSGYDGDELYAGAEPDGPLLLLCERPAQDLPGPDCFVIDRPVAGDVGVTWRFKRALLSQWRSIAAGVDRLMARFRAG